MEEHSLYHLMQDAVRLSRRGFGRVTPNPCVGAMLVKNGQVMAQGWHSAIGQEHAEIAALKDAASKGVNPADCILLVTLEPCNHYGKTPPCTKAIIEAGIRHVVIGAMDPNPQASGGADFLRAHGVLVETGIAKQKCLDNIADFMVWQQTSRPYVILKLAATLDGRIATQNGHSRWISGPQTLTAVHELRRSVQAVLVGGNTFRSDNPMLTWRLPDPAHEQAATVRQPLAVITTCHLPMADASFNILQQRAADAIFLTSAEAAESREAEALRAIGARVWGEPLPEALERLRYEENVYHLLCEGGGKLALSLLEQNLADEFRLHLSPKILGDGQARPLFDGRHPHCMDEAMGMRFAGMELCGEDLLLQLRPKKIPEKRSDALR